MERNGKLGKASALVVATLFALTASASAETLRLASNWGSSVYSVARTLEWVEAFNASDAAKAADISIQYVGGPEVAPATEQLTALTNGVIDVLFGAAGYYVGTVPEAYAFYGTEISPMDARANGAIDLINGIYSDRANAHVLGWVAAGVGYHIWLKDEPPLKPDGTPDLTGMKIRSSGLYNAWLESMGATPVAVPAPDIYTSLERGIVDGAAWPGLGITDFGFEKFVNYRIDPPVWQFDNLLWVNKDRWDSLAPEQKKVLTDSVIAFEPEAHAFYANLADEEAQEVAASGVKSFELTGSARDAYVANAQAMQWSQVEAKAADNYQDLRKLLPPSQ